MANIWLTFESLSTNFHTTTPDTYDRAGSAISDVLTLLIITLLISIIVYIFSNISEIKKEGLKGLYSFILYYIFTTMILILPYIIYLKYFSGNTVII